MLELIIILLSIIVYILYLITKNYDSFIGIIMFSLGFIILFLKLNYIPSNLFYVESTFWLTGLITCILVIVFTIFILLIKNNLKRKTLKFNFKYLIILLVLYIIFGFLQQLLFQFVFLESLSKLINNFYITILTGSVYYYLFHIKSKEIEFHPGTFILNVCFSTIYLTLGNLIWLGIAHGVLGTIYYLNLFKTDILRKKIKIIGKIL